MLVFGQHCSGGGDEQEAILHTLVFLTIYQIYSIYLVICAK